MREPACKIAAKSMPPAGNVDDGFEAREIVRADDGGRHFIGQLICRALKRDRGIGMGREIVADRFAKAMLEGSLAGFDTVKQIAPAR